MSITAPFLKFENISKQFFGIYAIENINFEIARGEILGLIGENGAGKSTLMNILGGVIQPDTGGIIFNGKEYRPEIPSDATKAGIMFVHQELNLFENLSISENIFIDRFPSRPGLPFIRKKEMRRKTKKILDSVGLDVSPNEIIERLSPGEKQLVEIAKVLNSDPEIIIFDEPTTSLTERETQQLFTLIKDLNKEEKTIIYISHILNDIADLTTQLRILRDGKLVGGGKTAEFSIENMISSMVGRDLEKLFPDRSSEPSTETSLEIRNVTKKGMVKDISFSIRKGEVLGLFGLMGSGRTELARILFGIDSFDSGEIIINSTKIKTPLPYTSISQKIAFITEDRREEGLMMDHSISENLSIVSLPYYISRVFKWINKKKLKDEMNDVIDSLHIKSGNIEKSPSRSLSGGNQQKVVIGKWLMANPSVLILDEPTRGIDIGAKYEIYKIIDRLAHEGASIFLISSELEELTGMCDRMIIMSQGEIVGEFTRDKFNSEDILSSAFRQGVTV